MLKRDMVISWLWDTFLLSKDYYVKFPQAQILESSPDSLRVQVTSLLLFLAGLSLSVLVLVQDL